MRLCGRFRRWLSGLIVAVLSGVPLAVEAVEPGTPLVLKDGRIAQVAVHVLLFEAGSGELTKSSETALRDIAASIHDDCFLTAQAIGHVEMEVADEADILAAHSLARARADRVQTMLIEAGLPEDSIVSVWDWQFSVPQPVVTLWVFSLNSDTDCANSSEDSVPVAALAEPQPAEVPTVRPEAEAIEADAGPEETLEIAKASTSQPADEIAPPLEGGVTAVHTVPFDINSSYFGANVGRELRALMRDLPEGRSYRVTLSAAVGTGDVRGADTAEEAARYNRWIAEERGRRVIDWLKANAGDRSLTFDESLIENDSSRRVVVGIAPAD